MYLVKFGLFCFFKCTSVDNDELPYQPIIPIMHMFELLTGFRIWKQLQRPYKAYQINPWILRNKKVNYITVLSIRFSVFELKGKQWKVTRTFQMSNTGGQILKMLQFEWKWSQIVQFDTPSHEKNSLLHFWRSLDNLYNMRNVVVSVSVHRFTGS